jgi:hypothetical protein
MVTDIKEPYLIATSSVPATYQHLLKQISNR